MICESFGINKASILESWRIVSFFACKGRGSGGNRACQQPICGYRRIRLEICLAFLTLMISCSAKFWHPISTTSHGPSRREHRALLRSRRKVSKMAQYPMGTVNPQALSPKTPKFPKTPKAPRPKPHKTPTYETAKPILNLAEPNV